MKRLSLGIVFAFLTFILLSFTVTQPVWRAARIQLEYSKVRSNLYFSKYEISNFEYRVFLNDLYNTHQIELLSICRPDTNLWAALFPEARPLSGFYFSARAYDNYPAVTMSYEGAVKYCEWLTLQYNSDKDRPFKKVIFRLPTEKEWIEAATGGKGVRKFSFAGSDLRNKKGLYLCNFKHEIKDSIKSESIRKSSTNNNLTSAKKILAEKSSFFQ